MNLTTQEVFMCVRALDKRIWSFQHNGLADTDARVAPFIALRLKMVEHLQSAGYAVPKNY